MFDWVLNKLTESNKYLDDWMAAVNFNQRNKFNLPIIYKFL